MLLFFFFFFFFSLYRVNGVQTKHNVDREGQMSLVSSR